MLLELIASEIASENNLSIFKPLCGTHYYVFCNTAAKRWNNYTANGQHTSKSLHNREMKLNQLNTKP
jgi:hypothetical protein